MTKSADRQLVADVAEMRKAGAYLPLDPDSPGGRAFASAMNSQIPVASHPGSGAHSLHSGSPQGSFDMSGAAISRRGRPDGRFKAQTASDRIMGAPNRSGGGRVGYQATVDAATGPTEDSMEEFQAASPFYQGGIQVMGAMRKARDAVVSPMARHEAAFMIVKAAYGPSSNHANRLVAPQPETTDGKPFGGTPRPRRVTVSRTSQAVYDLASKWAKRKGRSEPTWADMEKAADAVAAVNLKKSGGTCGKCGCAHRGGC